MSDKILTIFEVADAIDSHMSSVFIRFNDDEEIYRIELVEARSNGEIILQATAKPI